MDTCTIVWDALTPAKLSAKAKKAIKKADEDNELLICDISIWEISMLVQRKRIEVEEMPHEDTKEQEKIMIKQHNPLYNSKDAPTISDEYYEAQDIFGENS